MKIIITEKQYRIITEQMSYYPGYAKDEEAARNWYKQNAHTINTVLQIGSAFIPVIGPFISAGIGLADAAIYYKEGDTKTAGLIGLFSAIPGIGGLASKLGLTKWTAKALGEIGKKISLGAKLSPVEMQVTNRVAQYKQLIQSEMQKIGESATVKAGTQAARQKLNQRGAIKTAKETGKSLPSANQASKNTLNKIAKGGLKIAGSTIPYVGANITYDKVYNSFNPQKQIVNFDEIDVNKISQINKNAALNVKF